jgi:transaldolase
LPPETLAAYAEHGDPVVRITPEVVSEAKQRLASLAGAGFNLEEVTRALETEGLQKFAASATALLNAVGRKGGAPSKAPRRATARR